MSLSLAIREILDKIGSEDSFFPTEALDVTLLGPSTPESIALEESIRRLVARFQELEQKTIRLQHLDATTRPVTKQLQHIKGKCEVEKHVCLSCGHRLDGVPLTPEEIPPVDTRRSCIPKSSLFAVGKCVNL